MGKYWFLQNLESNDQKVFGVNIDRKSKLNHYISKQCKKAGRKLSAPIRICKFTSLRRRGGLMKSFIESQFAYCPLVWMCCDKISDNHINHLHQRATVYNDNVSTLEKLLEKDNCVTIYIRNLRILATELYGTRENLAALIMHEVFEQRNIQYSLRSQADFQLRLF